MKRAGVGALVGLAGCAQAALPLAPSAADGGEPQRILVRFAETTSTADRASLREKCRAVAAPGALPDREVWTLPAGTERADLVSRLRGAPELRYAAAEGRRTLQVAPGGGRTVLGFTAADRDLDDNGYFTQTGVLAAWARFEPTRPPGTGILVAVVASGVDVRHPELAHAIARDAQGAPRYIDAFADSGKSDTNSQGTYNWATAYQSASYPGPDGHGSGTRESGIIAASASAQPAGSYDMVGIAPGAQILPVKVLDVGGDGDDAIIMRGIVAAADAGADIVLLPFGGPEPSAALDDAVWYARSKGVLVVAAAGQYPEKVFFPAASPGALAIGAVDGKDEYMSYASTGPELALVAPGGTVDESRTGLLGPVPTYLSTTRYPGKYVAKNYSRVSGTSEAAAFAAGIAALVWSAEPDLDAGQVRQRLLAGATDLGQAGFDDKTGFGRIDAARSLAIGGHANGAP
ncbi:MAG: S8 family serine peptidase [Candidatus Sericytochromatia bacterium]|nr:S8 family serine peptidase [Candidatus Tanganyikabacteria bacterium]